MEEAWHEHEQLTDVLNAENQYPLQQFFLVAWRWTYMSQYRRETDLRTSKTAWLYHWYRYLTIDISMFMVIVLLARVVRINAIIRLAAFSVRHTTYSFTPFRRYAFSFSCRS